MSTTTIGTKRAPRYIVAWTLQIVVAAVFFAAGGAKLGGVPYMVQLFAQLGAGQWFRFVTGTVEVIGAFALVYPRLTPLGGLWLGFTMFCAVLIHLLVLHTSPAGALVLLLLNALIVYLRRSELRSIIRAVAERF